MASVFAAITIIGYVFAAISCISDQLKEAEIEASDEVVQHEEVDDGVIDPFTIDLEEEVI